jgi:hypothetical protein
MKKLKTFRTFKIEENYNYNDNDYKFIVMKNDKPISGWSYLSDAILDGIVDQVLGYTSPLPIDLDEMCDEMILDFDDDLTEKDLEELNYLISNMCETLGEEANISIEKV